MKKLNILLIIASILILSSIITLISSCGNVLDDSNGINQEVGICHKCNWKQCEYEGLNQLPAPYNPIDSIHFVHPEFDYDRCLEIDDSIFNLK